MSRIPPRSSRSPLKAPSTPSKTRLAPPSTPSQRARGDPISRSSTPTKPRLAPPVHDTEDTKTPLSIKEAIALKRAQAKKTQAASSKSALDDLGSVDDALPATKPAEEDDLLGRLPVRETIEKSRSTGVLNIATRSLPCLPSAMFEIHLNVIPEPLRSVPNEPKLPAAEPPVESRRGGNRPAWFEAQDLTVLKAWNNEITEIQHEISMFGSLKTLDIHKNKIVSLPKTIADLSFLTILDLSYNELTDLPENIWALPELTTLNVSHNHLTSLPFNAPFASTKSKTGPNSYPSTGFFAPAIVRAITPLPKLITLDASHNEITSSAIDLNIPKYLFKLDLSANPVGNSCELLRTLSTLPRLKELRFEKAIIGDDSIPSNLFSSAPFATLMFLDFSDTQATLSSVKSAFKMMKQELNHDFTVDDPPAGVVKILVGKRVIKEAWEIESERRREARTATPLVDDWGVPEPVERTVSPPKEAPKTISAISSKKEIVKEAWEIEAEQGLLTEGAKRRARATAAASEARARVTVAPATAIADEAPPVSDAATSVASAISSPKYYTQTTGTLKLPASVPPPKNAGHMRAFSMASSAAKSSFGTATSEDLALPVPTLPLSIILAQSFADTLRVLILTNRRLDRSFMVPSIPDEGSSGFLPKLEELDLEGCNFDDTVNVQRVLVKTSTSSPSTLGFDSGGTLTPPRSTEPFLATLAKLFPGLRTLNLAYNCLSDLSMTYETLSLLLLQSPSRAGLRHLRLRGNRLNDLSGFQKIAESFKGNREVPEWKLEELDLRDNGIGRLLPELGLLPLDVFLVEGNTFRVPQRRIWEREGTKGLLSWLRGRLE